MASDGQLDGKISRWLEEEAPTELPDRVLRTTFERTRRSRQRVGWRARLGRFRVTRFALEFSAVAVVVLAAALALNVDSTQPVFGGLPTTPGAWSRFLIDSRFDTAQVDEDSLAASPGGLLALVGELGSGDFQLAVSTDGRGWSQVPSNQHPPLVGRSVKLIGTDRGFVMVVDSEVWASADGFNWQRLAGPAQDRDLRLGKIRAVTVGGPGFVAVGSNNKAWYSTDGSDWSLAEVPPLPAGFGGPGYTGGAPTVAIDQVARSGDLLVAWGGASADNGVETVVEPVVWTSRDGQTWTNVLDPQIKSVSALAGGPSGFIAAGEVFDRAVARPQHVFSFSADGQAWETVDADVFESRNDEGMPIERWVEAVAAAGSGFVAVGRDGMCDRGPCPDAEAVVWISPDGRSWSLLPSSDLFRVNEPHDPAATEGSNATSVVAWKSRFVVGGHYDGKPVIWISGSERSGTGETTSPTAVAGTPTPDSTQRPTAPFAGRWEATDLPPDGSHLTMQVIAQPDGTYGLTIRDDVASVCGRTPSTMTGIAEPREPGTIVIEQPEYTCDDGSEPQALSGPPLVEQLRGLRFTYDSQRDELVDSFGLVWSRG
ncbi:hypothetical protein BH23CHL7_BH23CHL7_13560 [soil metagenome]